jgi:hypothetical protein
MEPLPLDYKMKEDSFVVFRRYNGENYDFAIFFIEANSFLVLPIAKAYFDCEFPMVINCLKDVCFMFVTNIGTEAESINHMDYYFLMNNKKDDESEEIEDNPIDPDDPYFLKKILKWKPDE